MNVLSNFKEKGILRTFREHRWSLRKIKFFWVLFHLRWIFAKWVFQKPKKKEVLIYVCKLGINCV